MAPNPRTKESKHVDGIQHNPNDWELDREMAMLLSFTEKRPAAALPYAEAGLKNADDEFSTHLMTKLCTSLRRDIHG